MEKRFEVSRWEDSLTILRPITAKEAKEMNPINYITVKDEKLLKFINLNIDKKSITIQGSGKVELGDETFYGISLKEPKKVEIAKKARKKLEGVVNTSDLVYYVDFIDTNNILNSRGFFITDDNKEEKYLEILETGDEDLIDTLEKFLISKDKLGPIKTARDEFETIIDDLKYADENNEDDLKQIELKIT